jgi:FAD/FMN-containing dehydrogenase
VEISRRNLLTASGSLGAAFVLDRRAKAASVSVHDGKTLGAKLKGPLYIRGDSAYEAARLGKGMTPVQNRFPALIVEAVTPEDIVRTIAFARSRGLDLSVRSGGHDVLAASTTPTGVMLDLGRMNAVALDTVTGIAHVGAGTRAGKLVAAGAKSGWIPVVGTHPNVGIGGLTLGGGMGWFAGSFGATVDHLLSAQVVTADGRILNANKDENSDIFWALRGGGGNFGVVTAFTFQMQRVPQMLAGSIAYQVEPTEFLRFYRDYLANTPDALELSLAFSTSSKGMAYIAACWLGDEAEGRAALRPLLNYASPTMNTIKPQSYMEFALGGQSGLEEAVLAGARLNWKGGVYGGLSDEVISAVAKVAAQTEVKDCYVTLCHYMHGALSSVAADSTPFVRPPGNICYAIAASWNDAASEAEVEQKTGWVDRAAGVLEPIKSDMSYINYLSTPNQVAVQKAYGKNFARLQQIKRKYDPFNIFHNNRNISPVS